MPMKQRIVLTFILLLMLTAFTGCNDDKTPPSSPPDQLVDIKPDDPVKEGEVDISELE